MARCTPSPREARSRRAATFIIACLAVAGCREEHILGEVNGVVAPCGAFAVGEDLAVCTATYLGGNGSTPAAAVEIGVDGTVVVADAIEGNDLGGTATALLGGGAGALLRLRSDGRQLLSITRLGSALYDLDVDRGRGAIAVVGAPFGVALLSSDAGRVLWQQQLAGSRVAVGDRGTVAVLDAEGGAVTVLDFTGATKSSFALMIDGLQATDIAVHDLSETVIVTGAVAAGAIATGSARQQPILVGYDFAGRLKWKDYGWREADVVPTSLGASTRGVALAMGRDGALYYVGESQGGNTTHGKNPRALEQTALVASSGDKYMTPYNTAAEILFVGRFKPADGTLEAAQFLLTRDATMGDKGQDVHAAAVAADERGNVIVGGTQRCCMQDQDRKSVRGHPVGRGDPDAFVAVLAPDLKKRLLWTTWSGGGAATTTGVAMGGGVAAMVAIHDQAEIAKGPLITVDAIQPTPLGGASQAFLSVWSAP